MYAEVTAAAAREPDVCGFRLYVERDNHAAQATYRALGMQQTDYLLLEQLRPGVVYLRQD
jgi:ribosomal protein S18 acetylase RimI-like enzyme